MYPEEPGSAVPERTPAAPKTDADVRVGSTEPHRAGRGLVLAFDTSLAVASAAVARDGEVTARRFLLRRDRHGSHLVPALEAALAETGAGPRDVDGVVVGKGPGSFTGVRVAAATARGLVRAREMPLWTYSSLAAAAVSDGVEIPPSGELPPAFQPAPGGVSPSAPPSGSESLRLVLFDARDERGYAALYRVGPRGLEEVRPPRAVELPALLDEGLPEGTVACGDGALRHAPTLEAEGVPVAPPPLGIPTADGLVRLTRLLPDSAPVPDPGRWTPDYLRPSRVGPAGKRS